MSEQLPKEEEVSLPDLMKWLRERHSELIGLGCNGTYEGCAHAYIERLSQDVARYESGRQVLTLLIDTQRDKIRELEQKLVAAEQLAVRQGNTIRQLRRDASDDRQSAATEESWKNKQGDEYGSY